MQALVRNGAESLPVSLLVATGICAHKGTAALTAGRAAFAVNLALQEQAVLLSVWGEPSCQGETFLLVVRP